MHDENFNDTVDSWSCGNKIAYDMCNAEEWRDCTYMQGQTGAGTARNPHTGHGDSELVHIASALRKHTKHTQQHL